LILQAAQNLFNIVLVVSKLVIILRPAFKQTAKKLFSKFVCENKKVCIFALPFWGSKKIR
jgi:hypothetical protein